MTDIFIDGSAGTTGLRIYERLADRDDINVITLSEELRKDMEARREAISSADIAFLCLPDAAAKEIVEFAADLDTAIIDTSTAHRTASEWTYGFPELIGNENIKNSKRIANPGCHASGFTALVTPLIREGILDENAMLTCFSITGYSGGGKKMIADYESKDRSRLLDAPRQYGITQQHKHLKEMVYITGIKNTPVFCPIVADFYSGMEVTVPVFKNDLKGNLQDIKSTYKNFYNGRLVHFDDEAEEDGFLSAAAFSGKDDMQISVNGNEDRVVLTARFDNLGKGASGSAIQNMNILLGLEETYGLEI